MMEEEELPEVEGRLLCLECMQSVLVGGDGRDEDEMRKFLACKGVHPPVSATYMDVLALFEDAESGAFDHFEDEIKSVKFPMLQTAALHPSQPDFERIKMVSVSDLCDIITDEDVPLDVAITLIRIFASLTKVQPRKKGQKMSYHYVIPTNIIVMANNSRVHTGERLLTRGLRHALDSGTRDILNGKITVAKQNGQVCMIVDNKILASMKSVHYSGSSAFNGEQLLATSCGCRAGCINRSVNDLGKSRVACTHSIARAIEVSQLFYRQNGAMTRQLLISLRSRIRKEGYDVCLDAAQMRRLKDDIILLIKATGNQPPILNAQTSLLHLLNEFAASTDKAKVSPGEPRLRDLGLLREKVSYDSPIAKAEKLLMNASPMAVDSTDSSDLDPLAIPNIPEGSATVKEYVNDRIASDGMSLCFSRGKFEHLSVQESKRTPIGFQLLQEWSRKGYEIRMNALEYGQRHKLIKKKADEVEHYLVAHTKRRGWKRILQRKGADDNNNKENNVPSLESRCKRPASSETDTVEEFRKKKARLYCCVDGCGNTDVTNDVKPTRTQTSPVSERYKRK